MDHMGFSHKGSRGGGIRCGLHLLSLLQPHAQGMGAMAASRAETLGPGRRAGHAGAPRRRTSRGLRRRPCRAYAEATTHPHAGVGRAGLTRTCAKMPGLAASLLGSSGLAAPCHRGTLPVPRTRGPQAQGPWSCRSTRGNRGRTQGRGDRETAHLGLVTTETRCLLLHNLDPGRETRGYATMRVSVYIYKGDSMGGGCQIRRGSRSGRVKDTVA
jgi:hypothetical protein